MDIVQQIPLHEASQLGFYLLTMVYCIYSAILYYHWKTYATGVKVIRWTLLTYFLTTVPLLALMGFTTFAI
jgi:hypothetical protein